MPDPYDLQRFVDAQAPIIDQAVAELEAGRKRSHWMWFVFPQIAGLGFSAMAQRYALHSLDEANAYLAHDRLGPRLGHCTDLVNRVEGRSIAAIFGSPDDMKFPLLDDPVLARRPGRRALPDGARAVFRRRARPGDPRPL